MILPPYGKAVRPGIPNLKIYTGVDSWERAKHRVGVNLPTLVLRHGEDPTQYRWPVAGLSLIVLDDDSERDYLKQFGRILIHAGAVLVVISRNSGNLPMLVSKRKVDAAA